MELLHTRKRDHCPSDDNKEEEKTEKKQCIKEEVMDDASPEKPVDDHYHDASERPIIDHDDHHHPLDDPSDLDPDTRSSKEKASSCAMRPPLLPVHTGVVAGLHAATIAMLQKATEKRHGTQVVRHGRVLDLVSFVAQGVPGTLILPSSSALIHPDDLFYACRIEDSTGENTLVIPMSLHRCASSLLDACLPMPTATHIPMLTYHYIVASVSAVPVAAMASASSSSSSSTSSSSSLSTALTLYKPLAQEVMLVCKYVEVVEDMNRLNFHLLSCIQDELLMNTSASTIDFHASELATVERFESKSLAMIPGMEVKRSGTTSNKRAAPQHRDAPVVGTAGPVPPLIGFESSQELMDAIVSKHSEIQRQKKAMILDIAQRARVTGTEPKAIVARACTMIQNNNNKKKKGTEKGGKK